MNSLRDEIKVKGSKFSLNFTNHVDQVPIEIMFGYFRDVPTLALFHNETVIFIPREIIQVALEEVWKED